VADRIVTLRDGRRIGLTAFGDPSAERIVLFCHPAPGSSGFDPDPTLTSSWGAHVVSVDRPGYGSSSPLAAERRPSIGRWAEDLAEYIEFVVEQARETGRTPLHKVGVVGWSAGGRVALALAARHPGLVDRVAVVATPAPDTAVRWIPEEVARRNAELLQLPVPVAKQRLQEMRRSQIADGGPGIRLLAKGEADDALLQRPGLEGRLQRMLQHAYEQGTVGIADDLLSFAGEDWSFDLEAVRAPVLLVYGAKDTIVSSAHGRWYRKHLPNAAPRLVVVPRAGHLVVAPAWERILQHVDPQHGRRSDA
jgi:pimeloyl-ACP methyl ester carboxylesterase